MIKTPVTMGFYTDPGAACREITGFCHNYGRKPALQHVSLDAQKSEVLALARAERFG